ncbi:7703_t:CDS:2 [Funneliformis geosporum]|uniref:12485_t:CDS:1 n=1 Tax=Funneliformis geosporum TaxID=1117311 RepID=A0A9W4SUI0_9GLOM|nr:7703_t:CDS:2 [Funneliformis geosporum]CAI2181046.1 12485_t:CDS:2 [Funneliformis geosporum]
MSVTSNMQNTRTTDWLDANYSDQSDSSDEEFVFNEDAVKDTSDSSEEENSNDESQEGELDRSTTANQKSPQHHTNGNSAVTYRDSTPINTPLINGTSHLAFDENGYTNGKNGAIRHRQENSLSHLFSPYGITSSRKTNGERIFNNGLESYSYDYRIRSGVRWTFAEHAQNRHLGEIGVPFQMFSKDFNKFHEVQESTLKDLKATEQNISQMNALLEEEVDKVKDECDELKSEYKNICEENKLIREQIEELHTFFLPYFNNLLSGDEGDDDEEDIENKHFDKIIVGNPIEKESNESENELDDVNIGPFIFELARLFEQQQ